KTALAAAILWLGSLLAAQTAPAPQPAPASPSQPAAARLTAADFPHGVDTNPFLVAGGDDPVVGINVGHVHTMYSEYCWGVLLISRDTIRFVVLQPEGFQQDAFQYARSELAVAKHWSNFLSLVRERKNASELKFRSGRTYHFVMLRPGALAGTPTPADIVPSPDIEGTINSFDATVARLKPPAPPAPPAPPVITMVEPAGAEESRPAEVGATLRVRGIATQPSGIAQVTVNGQPATLKALSPQTSEFLLASLAIGPGTSSVLVLATATDKTESHQVLSVMRPEVKITAPAPGAPVSEATVAVRGVASGFRELERVEVAGKSAALSRQPDGSVQFEVAAVPVPVGESTLQGSAVSSSGHSEPFTIAVKRLPPPGPPALGLKEVLDALSNRVPKARLLALIQQYGVDFALNEDIERQLREAGADSDLLLAIAKAKK
ncbi:MAG TPA: hypothetical protein VE825_17930, partial [Terriglobales bacterium]|nr:hypothetical protein [Terriglobales bacterium]